MDDENPRPRTPPSPDRWTVHPARPATPTPSTPKEQKPTRGVEGSWTPGLPPWSPSRRRPPPSDPPPTPRSQRPAFPHPPPAAIRDNAHAPILPPAAPAPRPVRTPVLIGRGPVVQPPGRSLGPGALRQRGLESASPKGTGGLGLGARPARAAPPSSHKRPSPLGGRSQPAGSRARSR
nr:proline-rich protein 2-like [Kogia breviceps]